MSTGWKAALWLTGIIAAVFLAFFVWIGYALTVESRISSVYSAFAVLGDRAIQLDRLGKTVALRVERNKVEVPDYIVKNPDLLNCDSPIEVADFDPSREESVRVLISDLWRPKVYLIYSGAAPDFGPLLNNNTGEILFLPPPPPEQTTESAEFSSRYDNRTSFYEDVIRPKMFAWQSEECENFTYTMIMGK